MGGTVLNVDPSGNYQGETGWNGSGGGESSCESEPTYQLGVQQSGHRDTPDVAFDAGTPVAICDSYDFGGSASWYADGGTSFATPCWAGMIAIANQLRASRGLGSLDGPSQTLPALYGLPTTDFCDNLGGDNGTMQTA